MREGDAALEVPGSSYRVGPMSTVAGPPGAGVRQRKLGDGFRQRDAFDDYAMAIESAALSESSESRYREGYAIFVNRLALELCERLRPMAQKPYLAAARARKGKR